MLTENFRIALRALSANKLRSLLTMLGIIIGVGAVVALLSIGQGATAGITSQIEGIGSNMIIVMPSQTEDANGVQRMGNLYLSDYTALRQELPATVGIAPAAQVNATLTYNKETVNVSVVATTPDYLQVRAYTVAYGRFILKVDQTREARVVVLGSQTAQDLFKGQNPLGRKIRLNGVNFEVVGVLEAKGSTGMGSQDETALVPLETGLTRLNRALAGQNNQPTLGTISLSAADADSVETLMATLERILRREHALKPTAEADFSVMSQSQILDMLTTITSTLTAFLGAIAAISLLVGGIGIMNIMLVSVTERTREIGLRKAVGAKRSAILAQFLTETLVLSLLGGGLGLVLGIGGAAVVTLTGLITAQVTLGTVTLAFGFAAAVGIFFGIYPAWRAAQLRPIEALRYE